MSLGADSQDGKGLQLETIMLNFSICFPRVFKKLRIKVISVVGFSKIMLYMSVTLTSININFRIGF